MSWLDNRDTRKRVFHICQRGMFVVNGVLFISGFVLFGVSLWALSEGRGFLSGGLYMSSATLLLIISIVVLFVSTIGFMGAKRQVRSFIIVFLSFLSLLLMLIIAASTMAWAFKGRMGDAFRDEMYDSVKKYFDSAFVQE